MPKKTKVFEENEFIELRTIYTTSTVIVKLCYHIGNGQLMIIKRNDNEKLNQNINHPFLPKYYGTIKSNNQASLVIEYINGQMLNNIKKLQFKLSTKVFNHFQPSL